MEEKGIGYTDTFLLNSVRSNTVRNLESAKVSVPPLVRSTDDDALGWRTDLIKTKPFWTGERDVK